MSLSLFFLKLKYSSETVNLFVKLILAYKSEGQLEIIDFVYLLPDAIQNPLGLSLVRVRWILAIQPCKLTDKYLG